MGNHILIVNNVLDTIIFCKSSTSNGHIDLFELASDYGSSLLIKEQMMRRKISKNK